MQDDINSPVVAIGGVAAAATTGALIAMGNRAGSIGLPFAAGGALLLHRTISGSTAVLVLLGLALHVVMAFVWSFIFVWIVARYVGRDMIAAVVVALAQFFASGLVTRATDDGMASILPLGDRIVLSLILAGSLVVGLRLALPRRAVI